MLSSSLSSTSTADDDDDELLDDDDDDDDDEVAASSAESDDDDDIDNAEAGPDNAEAASPPAAVVVDVAVLLGTRLSAAAAFCFFSSLSFCNRPAFVYGSILSVGGNEQNSFNFTFCIDSKLKSNRLSATVSTLGSLRMHTRLSVSILRSQGTQR